MQQQTEKNLKLLAAFGVGSVLGYWGLSSAFKCEDKANEKEKRKCRMLCGAGAFVVAALFVAMTWGYFDNVTVPRRESKRRIAAQRKRLASN